MNGVAALSGWIGVFAPASVANVGPGFDCFGFAVDRPGDTVHARIVDHPGVHIAQINNDAGRLPLQAELNTAGKAAQAVLAEYLDLAENYGIELIIDKGLPLCSGLGSSAASAVAGAVAAMLAIGAYDGRPYDDALVLRAALDGEAVAAGAVHADNVAPALLGGFTLVQSRSPLNVVRLEPRLNLRAALVTPAIEISTKQARAILPERVPLQDAVDNWSNAAALVAALLTADAALLAASLRDKIVEPCRAGLIPGFERVKAAALRSGALGCSISGAGPTLFALALDEPGARRAAEAMAAAFAEQGLAAEARVAALSLQGARRI